MIICDLSNNLLTVALDAPECEQLARILFDASQGCRATGDGDTAETLAGYFTMAAMICATGGVLVNSDEVMTKLDAIRQRVQGEEDEEEEEERE